MKWTKEKPNKEGWYWMKWGTQENEVIIVKIKSSLHGNELYFEWADHEITSLDNKECEDYEWYGPLQPPQEEATDGN